MLAAASFTKMVELLPYPITKEERVPPIVFDHHALT